MVGTDFAVLLTPQAVATAIRLRCLQVVLASMRPADERVSAATPPESQGLLC